MADVQVTCINKQPRNNPHEGITHLGGTGGGGWKWTRHEVINSINDGSKYASGEDRLSVGRLA